MKVTQYDCGTDVPGIGKGFSQTLQNDKSLNFISDFNYPKTNFNELVRSLNYLQPVQILIFRITNSFNHKSLT